MSKQKAGGPPPPPRDVPARPGNRLRTGASASRLLYQLQFDLRGLQACGIAALPRRCDEAATEVLAPAAWTHGPFPPLSPETLHRACHDNARLIAQRLLDVPMAVTLDAHAFDDDSFWTQARHALAASALPPRRLELEITEAAVISASSRGLRAATALGELGVGLVAADFGSGRASLAALRELRYGKLKISPALVAALPGDGDARALVRAALGVARGMNLCSAADGIETPAQLEFLRTAGCDIGQGPLLARPLSPGALWRWLRG